MSNKIVKSTQNSITIEGLLSQAVDKGLPVETMERLLAMRKELVAEQAMKAYISAMSKFQSECPIIKRDSVVKGKDGKERYRYAPLDSIVSQVKKVLTDNNLSYKFEEVKDDKYATAVCVVTHIDGHSERSSFKVEIGAEEYMTNTQKYGARMTFAKRYAFCNAFGILTGDEDNDAQEYLDKKIDDNMMKKYENDLNNCKNLGELQIVWSNLPARAKGQFNLLKEEIKKKYASS